MTPTSSSRRALALAAAPATLLLLGLVFFPAGGRDDTHLTCWPAYTLLRLGGLLNYNGERVEQSSSLLHVLLVFATGALSGASPVTLARIVSIAAGALAVPATYLLASRIDPRAALPSAFLTASSAYFAYWSYGGLEATLTALAVVLLILAWVRYAEAPRRSWLRLAAAALASLALVLARPEMPLVVTMVLAASCAVLLFRHALPRLLAPAVVSLAVSSAVLLGRYLYFHALFPQPVLAKSEGFSIGALGRGFLYVARLFDDPFVGIEVVLVAACMGYLAWKEITATRASLPALLSLGFLLVYAGFVVTAGGDWMEGGRFWVHVLPLALLCVPVALLRLTRSAIGTALGCAALIAFQLGGVVYFAAFESTSRPIWSAAGPARAYPPFAFSFFERQNRVHMRDMPTLAYLDGLVARLHEATGKTVTIQSKQMGMISYYVAMRHFGSIRTIDMCALTDRTFLECPATGSLPRDVGGLVLDYDVWIRERATLAAECGIEPADIVFDTTVKAAKQVASAGYTIVYNQVGEVASGSRRLPGRKVNAHQFIAVRDDLLPALGALEPVSHDFRTLQPSPTMERP